MHFASKEHQQDTWLGQLVYNLQLICWITCFYPKSKEGVIESLLENKYGWSQRH